MIRFDQVKRPAIDVDGVLADFMRPAQTYAQVISGRKVAEKDIIHYNMTKVWPEVGPQMMAHWRQQGFCAGLPTLPYTRRAIRKLYQVFGKSNVRFVTTPMPDAPFWIPERTAWLQYHYGVNPEKILYTFNKNEDTESDLLIDDHPDNVIKWANEGKPAILITQPFNTYLTMPGDMPIVRCLDLPSAVKFITGHDFRKRAS